MKRIAFALTTSCLVLVAVASVLSIYSVPAPQRTSPKEARTLNTLYRVACDLKGPFWTGDAPNVAIRMSKSTLESILHDCMRNDKNAYVDGWGKRFEVTIEEADGKLSLFVTSQGEDVDKSRVIALRIEYLPTITKAWMRIGGQETEILTSKEGK